MNSPDIFPTVAGLAGIKIPESVEGMDHLSLMTMGSGPAEDRGTLIHLPVPITEVRRYGFAEYRGLSARRYTYVRSIKGPWLLYDNQNDPFQMRNLIGKSVAKLLQARLNRDLDDELKRRKDEFPPAGEYLKRSGLSHNREANVQVGRHRSPWGDWDSTLPI